MLINIDIKLNPFDDQIEKKIINKINKNPPESYDTMNPNELDNIYNLVKNNFSEKQTKNLSIKTILSIRGNYMREHMIYRHKSLMSNKKKIIQDYLDGIQLEKLVQKYDGSPLNLLRIIFEHKYHMKLTKIIKNQNILESQDLTQLEWAINHDAYALINQDDILTKSNEFEDKIKILLDKLNIRYKTQNQLIEEQVIPTNTPDFLILDDFYLNGTKINWIDAKNFYGSKSKFIIKKIQSQTKKYIKEWGTGAIIFNLGFNSELFFDNILLVDFDSFENYIDK